MLKQVYRIYKRNGWPSNAFDRERCKDELFRWVEVVHAERLAASEAMDKANEPKRRAKTERWKKVMEERAAVEQQKS